MSRTIRWTRRSLGHLADLREYVAQDDVLASWRLTETIKAAVRMLAEQPSLGRPGRIVGTRELVISGTNYIVAYRVYNTDIEILAVLHGAQQWPSAL